MLWDAGIPFAVRYRKPDELRRNAYVASVRSR
jgi:hypothetical protein